MLKLLKPLLLLAAAGSFANGQDAAAGGDAAAADAGGDAAAADAGGDAAAADAGDAAPAAPVDHCAAGAVVDSDGKTIIRVAVIWETGVFKSDGTKFDSAFMDGFYFFNEELKKKEWTSQLGDPVTYSLEMHTFNSEMDSDKILVDFKNAIAGCMDVDGNGVGQYHFMIGATAKKNKDIMAIGEELQIPNIHASGGNPAMWWEHQEAAMARSQRNTYAFGMHLPFIGYTKPIIKAAAKPGSCGKPGGCKTAVILRPYGNFFQQTSAVAAVQWALDEGFEIIGPSKKWCEQNAGITTTCKVIGENCRCIDTDEPPKLSKAGVVYDPEAIATVYEVDEAKVVDGGFGLDRSHVYPEFVDAYKTVYEDVREQMEARGEEFVDVIVHWPIKYKSSVKALMDLNLQPKFFLGWNGGVKPNWVAGNSASMQADGGAVGDEAALDWVDGSHTFGFGQWHQALTYNDPFFQKDVAGIIELWNQEMNQGYSYDEFGAITTGVVLYLAVQKHLFKSDFVGATVQEQRDNLRVAVLNVQEETVWGYVTWNKYQQNTGGGISTTVAWQLQPGQDWANEPSASILVLPEAFAEGPFVPQFGTWAQRDGCAAVGDQSPWVVQPSSPFPICRNCDDYGTDISSAGLFVANDVSTQCSLDVCPVGNSMRDANTCQPCLPGQFNDQENNPTCDQCAVGKFSASEGASICDQCAPDSTTVRAGGSECVCKKGFYGAPGDGSDCVACPDFRTTVNLDARSITECVCEEGTYPIFDEDGSLLRCSNKFCYPNDASLVTFESSLDCPGNDGVRDSVAPIVRAGFWAASDTVLGETADIWKCLDSDFCPGGPTVNSCADHRIGTGCIWCEKGWRQETGTMSCVECDGASKAIFVVAAVVVFILFPLMLKPFVNTSVLKQSPSTVVGLTALSIVAFNIMSISSLGSYSLKWIEPLRTLIRVADIFQFDLNVIRVQCVVSHSSPVAVYIVQVVGPTILLALVGGLAFSVFKAKGKPVDWPIIVNLMGMLFSFFFVAIAVLSFYPHRCGVHHPFDEKALDRQPDVVCSTEGVYGETYTPLVILSIFAMLLYVVFYLSFIVWAVWKHQAMVIGQNQTFIRSTRFLFFRWKNDCYYWTLFWHGRSLFVALVPIISSGSEEGAILQIVLLITLMAAWLAQVSQTNPWRYARLNTLDRFATFLFVLMALSSSYQSEGIGWFVSIVLLSMGLFVIGFCGRELYMAKTASSRPKADFYLTFHRGSAAIIARAAKFTIEYHSGASVILSNDFLEIPDCMEASRGCRNIVVVWTDAITSCPVSAVEITAGVFNQQNIAILECESLDVSLQQERLAQVEDEWTEDSVEQFTALSLEASHITQAVMSLRERPCVQYNVLGSSKDREDAILSLLETCQAKNLKVPHLSTLADSVDLFIIHDHNNAQANACAFVLKNAMRSLSFAVATCSDYTNEKFPSTLLGRCANVVVLLNNGCLSNANFTASVAALSETCKITPVSIGGSFTAPTADRIHQVEKGDLDCDKGVVATMLGKESVDTKVVADRFRTLFKALALPLSPSGATSIMNAEISNIFQRVRSGKRGTTIQSILLK